VEEPGGGRRIVLFTTEALDVDEANRLLHAEGFRGPWRLDEARRVPSIPVLGTGKTDYKVLRQWITESERQPEAVGRGAWGRWSGGFGHGLRRFHAGVGRAGLRAHDSARRAVPRAQPRGGPRLVTAAAQARPGVRRARQRESALRDFGGP